MTDQVPSTSPESKKRDVLQLGEDELPDDVKARSCCGCIFFLFTLWIWGSVFGGLFLDELATREIMSLNQKTTLKCGWQAKSYKFPSDQERTTLDYPKGSTAQKAGESYLIATVLTSPFLVLLTISCCLRTGTKDEQPEQSIHPNNTKDLQRWDRHQKCCNNLHRTFKIIGMAGTFALSIAAYSLFINAIPDCASVPSGMTSAGDPRTGRTLTLLISAVVIASILILVVVVLIVLLTSENADQLGFVGAIVITMKTFGCDQGCPECNGGLDCADAGEEGTLDGLADACVCCCNSN